MKTDMEVKLTGTQALMAALGRVDAERFITLLRREPFDYTNWQRTLFEDKSLDEISREAMSYQKRQTGPS